MKTEIICTARTKCANRMLYFANKTRKFSVPI